MESNEFGGTNGAVAQAKVPVQTVALKDVVAGTYRAKAITWGYTKANTGNEGVQIQFEVQIPVAGKDDAYGVVLLDTSLWLQDNSWEITERALVTLGAWDAGVDEDTKNAVMMALCAGAGKLPNEVDLVVELRNEKYTDKNGKEREATGPVIKFINAVGGRQLRITALNETELKGVSNRLAAMFARRKAAAAGGGNVPKAPTLGGKQVDLPNAVGADEDIPF